MASGARLILILGGLLLIFVFFSIVWGISIYNEIVGLDEGVRAAWSQVENQYQRRYDLIPNLVETVKGYAKQEREVLIGVTEARASVGQLKVTQDILRDPKAFAQFQQAQDGLGAALSRLLVIVEKYPELKSNENFRDLQAQLEGTENRIAVARMQYNEKVQLYNTRIRRFPASIIASITGFNEVQYFKAAQGSEQAPRIQF
ncbi:MAG: LemA family protein [Bacteroidetes bacterium]|nr:LemA family protein [Bacteroidota bacterium]